MNFAFKSLVAAMGIVLLFCTKTVGAEEQECRINSNPQAAIDNAMKQLQISGDHELADLLDKFLCPVAKDNWEARSLRAQFVIAMFARYGAARIPEYSGKSAGDDAVKLLHKIELAESALKDMLEKQREGDFAYWLAHADEIFAIIDVSGASLEPAAKHWFGLFTSPLAGKISEARKLLYNAVRDDVYYVAYRNMFADTLRSKKTLPETSSPYVWSSILADTQKSCGRLAMLSGQEQKYANCTAKISELIDGNSPSIDKGE